VLQKHVYTFIFFFIGVICFGQTATISGTIKDDDGVSIPDVQIAILEDGSINTNSDANGKYTLTVPADKDITLSVYSISYKQVNQKFKLKHNLPENSPVKGVTSQSVSHYYGRDDHLLNWHQKWAFRWDFRTYLQVVIIPNVFQNFLNKAIAKVARDYGINLRGKFNSVARNDFKKSNSKGKFRIFDEFYNHDPKNGPLRYFSDIKVE
jgi:hypothetical protein